MYIQPGSPAAKAGLKKGDRVLEINGKKIEKAVEVTQVLVRLGSWATASYEIERNKVPFPAKIIPRDHVPDSALLLAPDSFAR